MNANDKRVRLGCYATNVSMSVVGNLSPILFLTFHDLYGISYSLLGLLVLINFCTQLGVDLLFSFFSHKFNIQATVRLTPILTTLGLLTYALAPTLFPSNVYLGLVLGTLIFSASSGLAEVLISPTIAALPSENPEREMSRLHSIYAWGVVFVILFGTLFLFLTDSTRWPILACLFLVIPIVASVLFLGARLPHMETPARASGALSMLRSRTLWLCIVAIFLGGASECTMAQWCSGYAEQALGIPKLWGDVFGVAAFALMLGLGRTLYAKRGRQIERVLLWGAVGATACYAISALTGIAIVGLLACALTGLCTSMMWPGSLIAAADRFPTGGVFIYAIMAAGGDLGASVGPQLVGLITDGVAEWSVTRSLATDWGLLPEQLGMKLGMLVGMLFPLVAIAVFYKLKKMKKES